MQLKHILTIMVAAVILTTATVASEGQSQSAHGPITYSGDAPILSPGPLPPGTAITKADELERNSQINALSNAAAEALFQGQYIAAEADARQALSIGPSGISDEVLAEALSAEGKDQEALQKYQSMVDEGNRFPRILLPYALLQLKAGNWTQALSAYNTAEPQLASTDVARINKGSVRGDDLLRANSNFAADRPQPQELAIKIHIALGIAFNSSGDWAHHSQDNLALAQYSQAVQLSGDSDLAEYYYGFGLNMLGRTAQAKAAYTRAMKTGHGDVKIAAMKALKNLKHSA